MKSENSSDKNELTLQEAIALLEKYGNTEYISELNNRMDLLENFLANDDVPEKQYDKRTYEPNHFEKIEACYRKEIARLDALREQKVTNKTKQHSTDVTKKQVAINATPANVFNKIKNVSSTIAKDITNKGIIQAAVSTSKTVGNVIGTQVSQATQHVTDKGVLQAAISTSKAVGNIIATQASQASQHIHSETKQINLENEINDLKQLLHNPVIKKQLKLFIAFNPKFNTRYIAAYETLSKFIEYYIRILDTSDSTIKDKNEARHKLTKYFNMLSKVNFYSTDITALQNRIHQTLSKNITTTPKKIKSRVVATQDYSPSNRNQVDNISPETTVRTATDIQLGTTATDSEKKQLDIPTKEDQEWSDKLKADAWARILEKQKLQEEKLKDEERIATLREEEKKANENEKKARTDAALAKTVADEDARNAKIIEADRLLKATQNQTSTPKITASLEEKKTIPRKDSKVKLDLPTLHESGPSFNINYPNRYFRTKIDLAKQLILELDSKDYAISIHAISELSKLQTEIKNNIQVTDNRSSITAELYYDITTALQNNQLKIKMNQIDMMLRTILITHADFWNKQLSIFSRLKTPTGIEQMITVFNSNKSKVEKLTEIRQIAIDRLNTKKFTRSEHTKNFYKIFSNIKDIKTLCNDPARLENFFNQLDNFNTTVFYEKQRKSVSIKKHH